MIKLKIQKHYQALSYITLQILTWPK